MRLLIALLGAALLLLQFRLWVADGGMREVWRLERQVAERTEENGVLAERNAALEAEVRDLKQGLDAAEERARTELGMVLPTESFYQIMPYRPPGPASPQPVAPERWPSAAAAAAPAAAAE